MILNANLLKSKVRKEIPAIHSVALILIHDIEELTQM